MEKTKTESLNIFGLPLRSCSLNPRTGFYRDGCCKTGPQDIGTHTVCAQVTHEFLEFSRSRGNDLITPRPEYDFPGLKEGDFWCLCASRWKEAYLAGVAPKLRLESCHEKSLEYIERQVLLKFAISDHDQNNR